MAGPQTRPRLLRRVLLVLSVGLAALIVIAAIRVGPLLLAPNIYAGTPSVERRSDYRDARLMRLAWAQPVARRYRAAPFEFQANQSFCGPTSLADVLHSLGGRANQREVIDGTRYDPWFGILIGGLTLDQLADLARRRTRQAVSIRRDLSLADFRAELKRVNDPARRFIVNFHRGPLFGRGHGHFSPLIAYLPQQDLVLVGDVNAAYRPFLVSSERLWRGVNTIDAASGRKRGLIVLETGRVAPPGA